MITIGSLPFASPPSPPHIAIDHYFASSNLTSTSSSSSFLSHRERRLLEYVKTNATAGDAIDVLRAIDEFAAQDSHLMTIGDSKGAEIDRILREKRPRVMIELGCYVGYSAIRFSQHLDLQLDPTAHYYSFELNEEFATIADEIIAVAGLQERVTIFRGTFEQRKQDLIEALAATHGSNKGKQKKKEEGQAEEVEAEAEPPVVGSTPKEEEVEKAVRKAVDVAFIDHAKDEYVPDLKRILEADLLAPGSIVIADNIKFPGAPEYVKYMAELVQDGKFDSRSVEKEMSNLTGVSDIVEVSTYRRGDD